jgi:hypothetical protein
MAEVGENHLSRNTLPGKTLDREGERMSLA